MIHFQILYVFTCDRFRDIFVSYQLANFSDFSRDRLTKIAGFFRRLINKFCFFFPQPAEEFQDFFTRSTDKLATDRQISRIFPTRLFTCNKFASFASFFRNQLLKIAGFFSATDQRISLFS